MKELYTMPDYQESDKILGEAVKRRLRTEQNSQPYTTQNPRTQQVQTQPVNQKPTQQTNQKPAQATNQKQAQKPKISTEEDIRLIELIESLTLNRITKIEDIKDSKIKNNLESIVQNKQILFAGDTEIDKDLSQTFIQHIHNLQTKIGTKGTLENQNKHQSVSPQKTDDTMDIMNVINIDLSTNSVIFSKAKECQLIDGGNQSVIINTEYKLIENTLYLFIYLFHTDNQTDIMDLVCITEMIKNNTAIILINN